MLDRELQRQILEHLRETYPHPDLKIMTREFAARDAFLANLMYLDEHGLISVKAKYSSRKPNVIEHAIAKITCYGLDFLEHDGGLNAILKTVPVHIIQAQEFLDLLEKHLRKSTLSEEAKDSLVSKLKAFATPPVQAVLGEVLINLPGLFR